MKAIAYMRVSTKRQSFFRQELEIQDWARRTGTEIVGWCKDFGVSGNAPLLSREGFVEALKVANEFQTKTIAVAEFSRLARSKVVGEEVETLCRQGLKFPTANEEIEKSFVKELRSVFENQDLSCNKASAVAAVSQYERSLICARTKAALAVKRARGEKLGGRVPFGHRIGADGKTLEPHADEQAVITQVRALRAEGVSLRAIVAKLTELGVTSRVGKPLALTQVARIAGSDPTAEIVRGILSSVALTEREMTKARIKSALAVRKRAGKRLGTVPYGFRALDDGALVPDDGEQAIIATARELRDGGATLIETARQLAVLGLVGRSGRPLAAQQIHRFLRATDVLKEAA